MGICDCWYAFVAFRLLNFFKIFFFVHNIRNISRNVFTVIIFKNIEISNYVREKVLVILCGPNKEMRLKVGINWLPQGKLQIKKPSLNEVTKKWAMTNHFNLLPFYNHSEFTLSLRKTIVVLTSCWQTRNCGYSTTLGYFQPKHYEKNILNLWNRIDSVMFT